MASAHVKSGSPYWYAWFRGPDGRRTSRATPLEIEDTPHSKAKEYASELERAAKQARKGVLTEERARKCISDMVEVVTGRPLLFATAETVLQDWLADKKDSRAKATYAAYSFVVDAFLETLGKRAKLNVQLVTNRDVIDFRSAQIAAGKTPQTANAYVKQLRIPFNRAIRQGLITTNPAQIDALPGTKATRGTFTVKQVTSIVRLAEKRDLVDWAGVTLLGYYTGQRLSDLANLQPRSLHLGAPEPHVRLRQRKTGRDVIVPIPPELATWFSRHGLPKPGSEYVFPTLAGRGTGGAHGLSGRFSELVQAVGIESGQARDGNDGGRKLAALSFHSLRHTFTSQLANAGVSDELRRKLTGHASAEQHKVYTHLEIATLQGAVKHLPSVM